VKLAGISAGFVLALGAALANAADAPAPASAPVAEKPAEAAVPAPAAKPARAPLKLRTGDVRKYMMPNEFQAAVDAPDPDKTTIIVEGERQAPPLKSEQPMPTGLGAVYSLFRHPTSAWRLFLPDLRAAPPGPPDVVPQRREFTCAANGECPRQR
jgi:hypothetical protein